MSLPPLAPDEAALLRDAVELFNTGGEYESHDLFEALWGPDIFKGFVQAAVALHHHRVGNAAGLAGLPQNVERILLAQPPDAYGLDVHGFARELVAFLSRHEPGTGYEHAPRIRWLATDATARPGPT